MSLTVVFCGLHFLAILCLAHRPFQATGHVPFNCNVYGLEDMRRSACLTPRFAWPRTQAYSDFPCCWEKIYNLAQDMPRPFTKLKALDIDELAQLITADGAAKA